MIVRSIAVAAFTSLALFTAAAVARADVSPERCASAYADAQLARRKGKLLEAREAARTCAQIACPAVGRSDCATWVSELDRQIPSVVVVARGGASSSGRAPRVTVDGVVRPEAAAARAIELDPGEHTFRVERDGDLPSEQVIAVFQGERDRILRFDLAPARAAVIAAPKAQTPNGSRSALAPSTDASPSASYVPAIVFSAVGVAALGASAILGLSGRNDLSSLRATCAPACSDADVDPVRRELVASDILLGVGAAAAVIGIYFFASPPSSGEAKPPSSGVRAGVEVRGTSLQLRASF